METGKSRGRSRGRSQGRSQGQEPGQELGQEAGGGNRRLRDAGGRADRPHLSFWFCQGPPQAFECPCPSSASQRERERLPRSRCPPVPVAPSSWNSTRGPWGRVSGLAGQNRREGRRADPPAPAPWSPRPAAPGGPRGSASQGHVAPLSSTLGPSGSRAHRRFERLLQGVSRTASKDTVKRRPCHSKFA